MNIEEIENIEKIKEFLNFTTEGTSLKINSEVSKLLLKYIKNLEITNKTLDRECSRLEQKEFILDKVTEFANKIVTKNKEKYNSKNQKEVDFSEWNLALEILDIIEGGTKEVKKVCYQIRYEEAREELAKQKITKNQARELLGLSKVENEGGKNEFI